MSRPKRRFLLLAFLISSLCFVACNDDETGNNGEDDGGGMDAVDTTESDTSDDADAPGDAEDSTSQTDADAMAGDAADTFDAWAECEPGTDADQECAHPASAASCTEGDWGASSFVETFVVEDNGECCFDLDGDGNLDSGISRLKSVISSLAGEDFNALIANEIEQGGLNYLFTYSNWENPVTDAEAQLDIVFGDSTSTWTEKQEGNGQFTVTQDSLDASGEPVSDLNTAEVCSSRIRVTGGTAPMQVPAGTGLVRVTLHDTHLVADVSDPADLSTGGKVALTNGKLGGYIPVDSIFAGLNDIAQSCDCLQKDVFGKVNDQWACSATDDDQTACSGDDVLPFCREFLSVPSVCGFAAQRIVGDADYDALPTDNPDGELDSYSFGATFTAAGAEITGTAQ